MLRQIFKFSGRPSISIQYTITRYLCSESAEPPDIDDMDLSKVVKKLNNFAPTTLAGSWDNVGLLVEPTPPHKVDTIFLTNDLTEDVMTEAVEAKSDMIIAYHPPIFVPMKRLTQRTWKEKIVIKCLENRIALFSPHTSFDAVKGGVNDWMLKPFDGTSEIIEQLDSPCFTTPGGFRADFTLPQDEEIAKTLQDQVLKIPGVLLMNKTSFENGDLTFTRLSLNCTHKALPKVVTLTGTDEDTKPTLEICELKKPPVPENGPGRLMKLKTPVTLDGAVDKIKQHFGLSHLRLATAVGVDKDKPIKKIGVCAGSGSSVLRGVDAQLYITGEMSHHEVLDANHRGIHVILCEHSNTERGFLAVFKDILLEMFESKCSVVVSAKDKDPLEIV